MALSRFTALALVFAAGFGLSACQTARGVQSDVTQGFTSVKSALQNFRPFDQTEESALVAAADPGMGDPVNYCPEVRIVTDLNQVHQFTDAAKPAPNQAISSIRMSSVEKDCRVEDQNMVIDMTLSFEGKAGPKARTKPADKPSFAYPYFIAITNNQGSIIAKEIFAVTMAYEKGKDSRSFTETVRQVIPLGDAPLKNYKVLIGFQLTEQELAYNRATPLAAIPVAQGHVIEAESSPVIQSPVSAD